MMKLSTIYLYFNSLAMRFVNAVPAGQYINVVRRCSSGTVLYTKAHICERGGSSI